MDDRRRYPLKPMVGVGVVVFQGDEVLLVKRGKQPRKGSWSLPGGLQELGETVHEAAAREVLEEAGVAIGNLRLLDTVDSIQRDDKGEIEYHYTLIDLRADWTAGDARGGSDADDARWFTPAELEAIELWQETRRIIALART